MEGEGGAVLHNIIPMSNIIITNEIKVNECAYLGFAKNIKNSDAILI